MNVRDLDDASVENCPPCHVPAIDFQRVILHELYHFGGVSEEAQCLISVTPLPGDDPHVCVAQLGRRLYQGVEHRLQIECRTADDLEHVGGGGLLLQRFAQLVQQSGVFNRDDGLAGEVPDQFDVPLG